MAPVVLNGAVAWPPAGLAMRRRIVLRAIIMRGERAHATGLDALQARQQRWGMWMLCAVFHKPNTVRAPPAAVPRLCIGT